MDESIPLRYRSVIDLRPDINSAVDALGRIFNLNLVKLRFQLLQEWLQQDSEQIRFDQSFTDVFSNLTRPDISTVSDNNLCR